MPRGGVQQDRLPVPDPGSDPVSTADVERFPASNPETEFLNIILTRDLSFLLHAIHGLLADF
jgi:hypothetical protein